MSKQGSGWAHGYRVAVVAFAVFGLAVVASPVLPTALVASPALPSAHLASAPASTVASSALASAAGGQQAWASRGDIESLTVQAEQLDEIVARRVRSGEQVGDEIGNELTAIFGELARFKAIQTRTAESGKEGTGVPKAEATALADRIAALRVKLRALEAEAPGAGAAAPGEEGREPGDVVAAEPEEVPADAPRPVAVPSGTRVMIRLKGWLSSKDTQAGDRFEAELVDDVVVAGELAIPAGAIFEGYVAEVKPARRPSRGGELQLEIDRIRQPDGSTTAVEATVVGAKFGDELVGEGPDARSAVTRGILGAILGGLIGGGKGALIGIGIGAGGTLLANEGEDVNLPDGTELRVRFDTSVSVSWGPARQRR